MNIYQVIMTPDAIDDMTALGNYIADVLGAPKSALSYVRAVGKKSGLYQKCRSDIGRWMKSPGTHGVLEDCL